MINSTPRGFCWFFVCLWLLWFCWFGGFFLTLCSKAPGTGNCQELCTELKDYVLKIQLIIFAFQQKFASVLYIGSTCILR